MRFSNQLSAHNLLISCRLPIHELPKRIRPTRVVSLNCQRRTARRETRGVVLDRQRETARRQNGLTGHLRRAAGGADTARAAAARPAEEDGRLRSFQVSSR